MKKPKDKGGRPKVPTADRKNKMVLVRLTTGEFKAIQAAAKTDDRNVSDFVRHALRLALGLLPKSGDQ